MKVPLYILFLIAFGVRAQSEYKASNNVTYHIGDTIKLGRGSGINGDFIYLTMGGWGALSEGSNSKSANKLYAGRGAIIKKIKSTRFHGSDRVQFAVGVGNITNYILAIEDAIATCEVIPCQKDTPSSSDKYDRLKKLKELLDSGAITQEEYDKEKKKILDGN